MKSRNTSYLVLAESLLRDLQQMCSVETVGRDIDTLRSRYKHEGESFLTITLPSFCKDFESSLEHGVIVPGAFRSFGKRLRAPAFLQGFLEQVFDFTTGGLLHEPNVEAIKAIRQITSFFKKEARVCTAEKVGAALDEFIQIELELAAFESKFDDFSAFDSVSHLLWPLVFRDFNSLETLPKHGPGATAERAYGNHKYSQPTWYHRLEEDFPFLGHKLPLGSYDSDEYHAVELVNPEDELPVRVIAVPKTQQKPRIIAIEPVCMQYTQQAISGYMVPLIEDHFITGGHINFRDQTVNQRLAIESSKTRRMATLDLSSASDRVPLRGVRHMLNACPDLLHAVLACRSERAQNKRFGTVPLRKFASMGSALCFPIEAMYFYTICVLALLESRNLPFTLPAIIEVAKEIYVYGDDIVVPTHEADIVTAHLQKYNCKVNTGKSFSKGYFRESCGADAYLGELVTPIYLRQPAPRDKRMVSSLVSWVDTSNQLFKAGYWYTSTLMKDQVESVLGKLPVVQEECGGIGWFSFMGVEKDSVFDLATQTPVIRTYVVQPRKRRDSLQGESALAKCLLKLQRRSEMTYLGEASDDNDHLTRSVAPGALTLKRRWCPT